MKTIHVPPLGESVSEAVVAKWFKKVGDFVKLDETIVELETDKVTLEVPATIQGIMREINAQEGDNVLPNQQLCAIEQKEKQPDNALDNADDKEKQQDDKHNHINTPQDKSVSDKKDILSPAVLKIVTENKVDYENIEGTGKEGRLIKFDVLKDIEKKSADKPSDSEQKNDADKKQKYQLNQDNTERTKVIPMTRVRITIAKRLKLAQQNAAILTTFNDVDMTEVLKTREQYKNEFLHKHNVKLGFMGFFVKAVVEALRQIPEVNAEIKNEDIIYKNYYHIGVAVGTDKGLVVPVIKEAEMKSLANIEAEIFQYSQKARMGKIGIEDMTGGTFTISNGGVYGSLLSTPILNAPQSAILGMHRIEKKPVVIDDKIEIRNMMYLALSYDHRIIDGKEAVTFLNIVKKNIEDPKRMLLEI